MITLPADKIFMPNEGMVTIDGFGGTGLFFKGLLNKIGVDFFVCQFEDFKSAAEMYSRTEFSDSARYALRVYINQFYNAFADNVSKYRKLDRSLVDEAVNNGLYTTDSMMAYKFIDEAKVEPAIKEDMAKLAWGKEYNKDKKLRLVNINDYMMSEPYHKDDKYDYENQIAIVYGSGTILQNEKQQIFQSEKNINANQFVTNLKKAVDDKKIKAIIIRIDSPGGSVLASEIIWQAIMSAKKVKPVYASMSDVAASGGYYMAMACDTIIASPTTITGSIGVISAIPSLAGTLKELGISADTVSTNKNSQFFNVYYPFPEKDKQKFYKLSKVIYDRFISKVAESRKMTYNQVRAIAKGRVWTGADAQKIGLVDTLGDLRASIEIAKRRVGIPKGKKVMFKIYPNPDDDMMTFLSIFGKGNKDEDEQIDNKVLLNDLSAKLGKSPSYLSEMLSIMPEDFKKQFLYTLSLYQMSKTEKVLATMPYAVDIR
jgi:protease IV